MKYRIARITVFIAALSAFPLFLFAQFMVAVAGHNAPMGNLFFQVIGYCALTCLLIYYAYRFHKTFWFYRILTKWLLLTLLFPILYYSSVLIYDGIINKNSFFPAWLTIPLCLFIIYEAFIFIYGFMMDKMKGD